MKFWIYEIKDGEIIGKNLLVLSPEQSFYNSSGDEPHPLNNVQVLISGGMGRGLVRRLQRKGIEAVITKETDLDNALSAYLDASLVRVTLQCHKDEGEEKHQHPHQHRHQCESTSAI